MVLGDDAAMNVSDAVAAVGRLWQLDTAGWSVVVDDPTLTVRLPACGAALHVSRPEVGPERVAALQTARSRLAACALPVVELLPSSAGATWGTVDGRVVEVERWMEHDGRMNTWSRLRSGAALLANVHDAWLGLDLGASAEACTWANWIAPEEVLAACTQAGRRLSSWDLGELAGDVVRLAELTSDHYDVPTQVVHGDFWDNNIYVRGEQLIAVTDFDFLGRRPRIDDLALLLYFADEQPYFTGARPRSAHTRRSELAPLVHAYADSLATPLTTAETLALPYSLARQPLWVFGKWLLTEPDVEWARREALDCAGAVARGLEIMAEPDRWVETFGVSA